MAPNVPDLIRTPQRTSRVTATRWLTSSALAITLTVSVALMAREKSPVHVTIEHLSEGYPDRSNAVRVLVPGKANEVWSVAVWRNGMRKVVKTWAKAEGDRTILTAETACAKDDILVVESDQTIAAVTLPAGCGDIVELQLLPRVTVSGRVAVPSAAPVPRWGVVRATGCGSHDLNIAVPVQMTDSKIETGLPSGCKALSLRAERFAPVQLPSFSGSERNIGTLTLKLGAVVSLVVRAGRDAAVVPGVRIAAVREHALANARGGIDLKTLAIDEVVTDQEGRARFSSLPEERLIFLLYYEDRKYPQVTEPYSFRAGEEAAEEALVLETPSNIVVTITMPKSLSGQLIIDNIEIKPIGHNHWPARAPLRTRLTPDGAVVEDVPPGTWSVAAAGRLKDGFVVRTAETTIDVGTGVDQYVALTILDTLYRGVVTRDTSPIAGVLNLKPVGRTNGRRSAVAAVGSDGLFTVLLEGPGEYVATMQHWPKGGTVTLDRYVAFDDPDKDVKIELPTGRIHGRVLDPAGTPVARANVSASQQIAAPAGAAFARSAPDGTFELDSIAAGTWELVAESETERSEPVLIAVSSADIDTVSLVVDPVMKVPVRVLDATGTPLAGAFVTAQFPQRDRAGSKIDVQSTNADGIAEFRVSRAQQATVINLVTMTRDRQISCELRRMDGEQTIIVKPGSGELRLTGRAWGAWANVQGWLIASSGCGVPFLAKSEREPSGDIAIVFPRLAAGRWTYVETHSPAELTALLTGRAASLAPIKSFTIEAGATVRVSLPPGR